VAVFHDNFAQMGGAERVAQALHQIFDNADLLSTLTVDERLTPYLREHRPRNTWMQRLPFKTKYFRYYFLLYPFAVEGVDLRSYRLIVGSCFGYAKGIRRRSEGSVHVCYCHNPMRWVWRTQDYISREKMGWLKRNLLLALLKPLKAWEMRAARQPDLYIANSKVVAERLKLAFGVEAQVICPPIETARFRIADGPKDYYLVLSRIVPYKRIDIAVEACTRLGLPLYVIGDGPDRKRLESLAGPTVKFLLRQDDAAVSKYMSGCKALLFPGEEDFGMVPLEANAAGRPVVAFRGGGAEETVVEGLNGVFFDQPNAESMAAAILRLEAMEWDSQAIRRHAEGYDIAVFQRRILEALRQAAPQLDLASAVRKDLAASLR
jgi:glycosyltransferase involved in cell wall biosynthesis